MSNTEIKFGTDGWRGVIAEEFTFANVRRVAQATADYWNAQPLPKRAIVGYDNRFLSEDFAKTVCEVFAGNGIKAFYPRAAAPTPAISLAVRDYKLCGAVMITASHNPPQFNGYKLKAEFAGSAEPEMCRAIEARVDQSPVRSLRFDDAVARGTIELCDPRPAHLAAVRKLVDLPMIRRAKLRVVVDSMHGSGGELLSTLLSGGRCRVEAIRADRDPLFGGVNPEPINQNLRALGAAVKRSRAHIGLATDGDADRLGIVDERGRYVSVQFVFALLLLHIVRNRGKASGLVVRSANCTYLIDRICREYGLKCEEVPVGFKWICQQMRATDVLFGGEESGGFGFRGHIPERDGFLAALIMLELLAATGQSISRLVQELQKEFGASVYDRIDIILPIRQREEAIERIRRNQRHSILGVKVFKVDTSDGVKFTLADSSWLMFRASGTEPIVRVYSETGTRSRLASMLREGQKCLLRAVHLR